MNKYKILLHGIDTLQCAYYMKATERPAIPFHTLYRKKESLRAGKKREPAAIRLGNMDFFLHPFGSRSGFPFVITNEDFKIEFGQYNTPNFFVTFRSQALWRESEQFLHEKFLEWGMSVGYRPNDQESLSRVDFSFDFEITEIDFDEKNFISRSNKDSQFRENGKVQTFSFGRDDIVLRVYDKVSEIIQKSTKTWFFLLWGKDRDVWRIEWQVRKSILKSFGIRTFDDLKKKQGDLLQYLSHEHDTLRIPNGDSNPSRWPLHPVWKDLQNQIKGLDHVGISRISGRNCALDERETRIGISILGYLKRYAALQCVRDRKKSMNIAEALKRLQGFILLIYDPLTWQIDVQKKIKEIELGEW